MNCCPTQVQRPAHQNIPRTGNPDPVNPVSGSNPRHAGFARSAGSCIRALADRLIAMLDGRAAIKRELHAAQLCGELERLRRPAIAAVYRRALAAGADAPARAA